MISQNEMGGMGLGRRGTGCLKVEQMLCLDIAELQRQGLSNVALMQIGWPSGARMSILRTSTDLRLLYRVRSGNEEWQRVQEIVPLETTRTRFGGQRVWLQCPACNVRRRILYGGPRFRCRRCHGLRYSSQSETKADRANRGMFKIVKRLAPSRTYNDLPARPQGMHRATYKRLAKRYERYDERWAIEALRLLRRRNRR